MAGGHWDGRRGDAMSLWEAEAFAQEHRRRLLPACCSPCPGLLPNTASSARLLKLFHKLPWQSRALPNGEALPIAQLGGCSLLWALPGGTGISDPLGSPAEDEPRAAKFTPASPVPPTGGTAAAQR